MTHSGEKRTQPDYYDGCYERYASTTALVQAAMAYDPSLDNGRKIFARLDDPNVMQILDRWVDEIMLGLSSLTHIFNPACIVLGGGITSWPELLPELKAHIDHLVTWRDGVLTPNVRLCTHRNDANILGAVYHLKLRYGL